MRVECTKDAPVSMTFGIIGQKDSKVTLTTLGTVSSIAQFYSHQAKVYSDSPGTTEIVNVDSITFTYTRDITEDWHTMNDRFLKGHLPMQSKLEGSMDLLYNSWDAYESFWGGTDGPQATVSNVALSVYVTGPSLGGSGDFANHEMRWEMPTIQYTGIEEPFERRDKIMQTVNFKGARGSVSGGTALCQAILFNATSTA